MQVVGSRGTIATDGRGILRVCVNGNRGAVCDSGWSYASAKIACTEAGYSPYGIILI